MLKRTPFDERLADFQKLGEVPCWVWPGHKRNGYGRVCIKRDGVARLYSVHRLAYERLVGPIPDGMKLDHLCRNPSCLNPTHLEVVTQRENIFRGQGVAVRNAARTHCPRGHPYSPENTRHVMTVVGTPARVCRMCERRSARERYWRQKGHQAPLE